MKLNAIEKKRLLLENTRKETMEGHTIRGKAEGLRKEKNLGGIFVAWKIVIILIKLFKV